jgi:acylphosphatase
MVKELQATVTGHVQGVFYRATIQNWAQQHGIKGVAENRPDGSVYVRAQGSETALEQLVEKLWEGSQAAQVENVAVTWGEPDEYLDDFITR